jgi:two-component system LytT family response regulator
MLTAILVDDEKSSLNSLEQKIRSHCKQVEIVGAFNDPAYGIIAIEEMKPDIVFLDIEMPVTNGFTLLQQLNYRGFELIFVTAYDHYAVKAIRYSALDYLVKPVEIEDLKNAVNRAESKRNSHSSNHQIELLLENMVNEKLKFKRIALRTREGLQFINIDSIIYLEASINYTRFYMHDDIKYTVSKTMKEFQDMLPTEIFIRIHNSYIVNKNYVEKYIRGDGGQVMLRNGAVLDVAKRKKAEFLKALGK